MKPLKDESNWVNTFMSPLTKLRKEKKMTDKELFQDYRRDMSPEGAWAMVRRYWKRISIILIALILPGCSQQQPQECNVFTSDIGVRVDGTCKLDLKVEGDVNVSRWIAEPEYLPIDDCDFNRLLVLELNAGDVWVCSEEPGSSIRILAIDDFCHEYVYVKITQNGRSICGECNIHDLCRTLACGGKFVKEQ